MRSRFTVHPLLHRPGHAMIAQDGEHLMTVDDVMGANLLAELLEKASMIADAVSERLGGGDSDLGRRRVASAVATAMGERLDLRPLPAFQPDRHSSCAERLL